MSFIKIKDVTFRSPILTASGTFGYGDEMKNIIDLRSLGCIITKSITLEPQNGNAHPRIFKSNSGMLNAIGLANVGVQNFCDKKLVKLSGLDTNVLISIAGSQINDYIKVLKKIESCNGTQIGYEINVSCPNIKSGGMELGVDKDAVYKLTKKLRDLTDKLLFIKLSPNVTNIQEIALSVEAAGADGISAINTVVGMGIDIKTYKPHLSTIVGGLSGPAIKPIALANIYKISKVVNIPIIGIGGITCLDDIIEFVLAGADLVQVGTLNYRNPNLFIKLYNDLNNYCKLNKLDSIHDLKGKLKLN